MSYSYPKFMRAIRLNAHVTRDSTDKSLIAQYKPLKQLNDKVYDKCICGHSIYNRFIIQNCITGKILKVGSTCIKRFESDIKIKCWSTIFLDAFKKNKKYHTCNMCNIIVNNYSKDNHIRDFHPAEFKIEEANRIEEANLIAMKNDKGSCCEICHMPIDPCIYYQHAISCRNV